MVNATIFAVLVVSGVGAIAGSVLWAIQWARKLKDMGIFEQFDDTAIESSYLERRARAHK